MVLLAGWSYIDIFRQETGGLNSRPVLLSSCL